MWILVELSHCRPPSLSLLRAAKSGLMVKCVDVLCEVGNLCMSMNRRLQNPSGFKPRETREDSAGPLWIRSGGSLTAHNIHCEGSLTVDQGSPRHGHLKRSRKLVNYCSALLLTNFLSAPSE